LSQKKYLKIFKAHIGAQKRTFSKITPPALLAKVGAHFSVKLKILKNH
jgi:hypothetical protein